MNTQMAESLFETKKSRELRNLISIEVDKALEPFQKEIDSINEQLSLEVNSKVKRDLKDRRRQLTGKMGSTSKNISRRLKEKHGFKPFPSFRIVISTKYYMYMIDDDNGWATITNSVLAVIEKMCSEKQLFGQELYYKDTLGNIDQILYDPFENDFKGFKPGCSIKEILKYRD